MSVYSRVCRLRRTLPQLGWGERFLFAISELIRRHQRKFQIKNVFGEYFADGPVFPYSTDRTTGESFSELVSVMGFGHSGSGAVLDLLAEYDGVTALYNHEDGSCNHNPEFCEFELLRHSGGLFMLEKAITEQSEAQKDAAIKQFLNLCEWLHFRIGGLYNDRFVRLARRFLDSLLSCRISTCQSPDYTWVHCPHLKVFGTGGDRLIWGDDNGAGGIYLLNKIDVVKYRSLAREFIMELLHGIESQRILVLDQIAQDSFCDMNRYEDYLGPFKAIYAVRDPRDVYVTGNRLGELWVPRDPDVFVKWYLEDRGVDRCMSMSHPNALVIRFEDLVNEYDKTVQRIEDHLGLGRDQHVRARKFFNPEISRRNVGVYKEATSEAEAVNYIGKCLHRFCYNG